MEPAFEQVTYSGLQVVDIWGFLEFEVVVSEELLDFFFVLFCYMEWEWAYSLVFVSVFFFPNYGASYCAEFSCFGFSYSNA